MPPSMFPGAITWPARGPRISWVRRSAAAMREAISRATSSSRERRSRMWLVPIISVVSLKMAVPPFSTSQSAASPTLGFAVTPEKASEPPHSRPRTTALKGKAVLLLFRRRCQHAAHYLHTFGRRPPRASNVLDVEELHRLAAVGHPLRQVFRLDHLAPQAHHQHAVDVGIAGQVGQGLEVQPQVLASPAAAVPVRQRHRVRQLPGDGGDDPVGAGHGGDDGDVVPYANRAVRPGVSIKIAHLSHPTTFNPRPPGCGCAPSLPPRCPRWPAR